MDSPRLYRYLRDDAAIKTIESRCFRVSRLTELNDPYEWRVGFEGHPLELEDVLDKQMEGYIEHANQSMGIICFSKSIKDPILWSHYTNVHRGIAFQVSVDVHQALVANLHEVIYDKPLVTIPFKRFPAMPETELLELFQKFYKYKSASWRYEQESRLVIDLKACRPSGGSYLWDKMPANFITHAIIGFRSSISHQYLRQALDLNGFQHTQILKAKRSIQSYEIQLVAMDDAKRA
jgi:hypothetical protein